jgi:hypothetical protein
MACTSKEGITISTTDNNNTTRKKPWVFIGVLLSIAGLVWLMIAMLPEGFKMTHEQIGSGKPSLVFVYDPNLSVSISQSEQMNIARDQIGEQVFFLVAKIGTPEGDQLIARHRAHQAELLLFDPAGKLIKRQSALKNADELIRWFGMDGLESRPK